MYNIYNSLLTTAQAFPYQLAIKDEFGEISYQVLFEETEKLKSDLKKLNIARGDKIGVLCNDNRHFIICLYASVATGAVVMPISLQQNIHEIRDNINEAGLQYLVGTQNDLALEYKHVLEVMPYTVFKTGISANGSLLEVVPNPAFMRFT
jgi:long-chain acyl-CoA synthetase